jgi:hypothetical protein
MPAQFAVIRGDSGKITVAAGAVAALISKWVIVPTGQRPDGRPILQFKAQFRWLNETLLNLKIRGLPVQKRVIVELRTKNGIEEVDILGWKEWRLEHGVLVLEDITHAEGVQRRRIR